jgi:hypothetical protein
VKKPLRARAMVTDAEIAAIDTPQTTKCTSAWSMSARFQRKKMKKSKYRPFNYIPCTVYRLQ